MEDHQTPEIVFKASEVQTGLELISLQKLFKMSGEPLDHDPFKMHRVNFFIILVITGGSSNHIVDYQEYSLTAGDTLIISKGQVHAFDRNSSNEGFIVLFTEEFLLKTMAHSTVQQISHLYNYHLHQSLVNSPELNEQMLNELSSEFANSEQFGYQNILGATLSKYLIKLQGLTPETLPQCDLQKSRITLFLDFKRLVENEFHISRDAKYFAKKLLVSYKHLNETCKLFTGKTCKHFIDNYVILEIKRVLSTTDHSLKEISYITGFDEPTNFHKFFKKHVNSSPSEFRLNS